MVDVDDQGDVAIDELALDTTYESFKMILCKELVGKSGSS